ncbi:MAG: MotA/TolQ/ExbB proton channel family protein [Planctomycetota bacterium]|nr:MotA/TolQ/ExbB proton channel family protein [Planctomycetota bacterium]
MVELFEILGILDYFVIAAVALWGLYCAIIVMTRVSSKRFKTEADQDAFLDSVLGPLAEGDYDTVIKNCEGNPKALPIMVHLGVENRELGYQKVRQYVLDRFQRDVLSDLENRIAWIATCVKTAPLLGLFGTVLGMLGAFRNLEESTQADPGALAGDIRMALEHTAMGLAVAIPLGIILALVNNRIRGMQELVASGLNRFLDALKVGMTRRTPNKVVSSRGS